MRLYDFPRSSLRGRCTWTISGDAGDSDDSSPLASLATSSVASLPAGADVVRCGTTSSCGASVVRCGATCSVGTLMVRYGATRSDGATVVLSWAKTSWADGLRVEMMIMDPC